MKRPMKIIIGILIFSAAVTGCAQKSLQPKNDGSFAYDERQALMERTPMEQWREMRQKSEVEETTQVKWLPKAKPLALAAAAETKKRSKTNAAKNIKKTAKQQSKPDAIGENKPDLAARKNSSS
jgi:uncharacterized protein YqjF (DUF2071 family)